MSYRKANCGCSKKSKRSPSIERFYDLVAVKQKRGNMKLAERKIGTNIVLEVLESRLGADKAAAFKEEVSRHLTAGAASLVLDLSKVDFIDSSGLGAILAIFK